MSVTRSLSRSNILKASLVFSFILLVLSILLTLINIVRLGRPLASQGANTNPQLDNLIQATELISTQTLDISN